MATGFLKPSGDDIFAPSWREDRSDMDSIKETSFVYNPRSSMPIHSQKQKLPIAKNRDHILYLLEQNQVLVIVGETGCGKSTQIPQFLSGSVGPGKMVGVTEPRRVAVTTLASRVSEEMGTPLGRTVGYSIRLDECFDRDLTKIKFMTEGILIREMLGDPLLRNYNILMIDEAHERTTNVDIILGLLKKIIRKRKDLKVVISSATIDAEYMKDFFAEKDTSVAILSIEGRCFSVDVHYLKEPCPNYVQCCAETVMKIHAEESPGDILVFLTGMDEVDQCVNMLREHSQNRDANKHGLKVWPVPMYGALSPHDQLKAFRPSTRGLRKVVVATNIAETSITIEGICHVIDSCFVKLKWFNPETSVDSLIITEVSKASALQRAGRAGRTRPGKCYRLCTRESFEKLPLNTPPEMQRTDLSLPVLQLKAMGIENIVKFEFPSAPPAKNLISSLEVLYALGAIDDSGSLTIPLGERMSEFTVHPTLAKVILSSPTFNCCEEICAIVAMLNVDNVFIQPSPSQALNARIARRKFEVKEGDLLTLLNVYSAYKQRESDPKEWCSRHFVKMKALKRADHFYENLIRTLARYKLHRPSNGRGIMTAADSADKLDDIRKCIVSGLFPNAAYLHMSGNYRTVKGDIPLAVHPTSVLYTMSPQPPWILFNEIVHTSKIHIKDITAIDPIWLEVLAPHYYEKVLSRS